MINNPPTEIIELIIAKSAAKTGHSDEGNEEIPSGQRDDALIRICGILKLKGLSFDEIHSKLTEINNKRCIPPLPSSDIKRIAGRSIGWEGPIEKQEGMPELRRNKQGIADGAMSNLSVILHYDPRLKGVFMWNELYDDCFIVQTPPWETKKIERQVTSIDYHNFKNWLTDRQFGSGHWIADPTETHIHEAVSVIANKNKYHPVREWLYSHSWDGTERVENFCHNVFGVENSPYHKIVGKLLLYGSTARALYPGCKFDYMPILSGKQGILKSTLIKELFNPWYGEISGININELGIQVVGHWAAEDAELVCMKRIGDASYKAWMSNDSDSFRPPYDRRPKKVKKGYIVIGTTNKDEFLHDITGGRRFLPVYCGNRNIDISYVIAFRGQLFAEARVLVEKIGEQNIGRLWTGFDKELKKNIEDIQEIARVKGSLEEMIIDFIDSFDAATFRERLSQIDIIKGCIRSNMINGTTTLRVTDFSKIDIDSIMSKQGWIKHGFHWRKNSEGESKGIVVPIRQEKGLENSSPSEEDIF